MDSRTLADRTAWTWPDSLALDTGLAVESSSMETDPVSEALFAPRNLENPKNTASNGHALAPAGTGKGSAGSSDDGGSRAAMSDDSIAADKAPANSFHSSQSGDDSGSSSFAALGRTRNQAPSFAGSSATTAVNADAQSFTGSATEDTASTAAASSVHGRHHHSRNRSSPDSGSGTGSASGSGVVGGGDNSSASGRSRGSPPEADAMSISASVSTSAQPTPNLDDQMMDTPGSALPSASFEFRFPLPPQAFANASNSASRPLSYPPSSADSAALVERALRSTELAPYLPYSMANMQPGQQQREITLVHVASFTNLHVATALDALVLIQACRMGIGRSVEKRLTAEQRKSAVASGTVFVFEEGGSGIKRWTDGRRWTPSRVNGSFLVYREVDTDAAKSAKQQAKEAAALESSSGSPIVLDNDDFLPPSPDQAQTPGGGNKQPSRSEAFNYLLPNGLVKKAISIPSALQRQGARPPIPDPTTRSFHLVHYFRPRDVTDGRLKQPSMLRAFDEIKAHAVQWGKNAGMLGEEDGGEESPSLELDNDAFIAAKSSGNPTRRSKSGDLRAYAYAGSQGRGSSMSPTSPTISSPLTAPMASVKPEVGAAIGHVADSEDIFAAERQARPSHHQHHHHRRVGNGTPAAPYRLAPDQARYANTPSLPTGMQVRPRANSLQFPIQQHNYGLPVPEPAQIRALDEFLAGANFNGQPPEFAYPDMHFEMDDAAAAFAQSFSPVQPAPRRATGDYPNELAMRAAVAAATAAAVAAHHANMNNGGVGRDSNNNNGNVASPLTQLATYFDNTMNPVNLLAPSPLQAPSRNMQGSPAISAAAWSRDHLGRPMMQPYSNFPPVGSASGSHSGQGAIDLLSVDEDSNSHASFFPDIIDDPMLAAHAARNKRTITEVSSQSGSNTDSDGEQKAGEEVQEPSANLRGDDRMDQTQSWETAGTNMTLFPNQLEGDTTMQSNASTAGTFDWFMTNYAATAAEAAAVLQSKAPLAVTDIPGVKTSPTTATESFSDASSIRSGQQSARSSMQVGPSWPSELAVRPSLQPLLGSQQPFLNRGSNSQTHGYGSRASKK